MPTPYVNTASNTQAINFATTVLVECGNALSMKSSVPSSTGDEAGTSHPVTKQEGRYTTGNVSVFVEQSPAVTFSSLSTGNAMNASSGLVSVQSAATVYFTNAAEEIPAPGQSLGLAQLVSLAGSVCHDPLAVRSHDREDGRRHIRIERFTEDVGVLVARALEHTDMSSLVIIDLRGNPGGDLDAALGLASDFLDDGTLLGIVVDADGDRTPRHARGPARHRHPVELWVDGGTASAAEVFASALEKAGRATLVGSPTHGKGTIQRSVSGAYMTVGEVLNADGSSLDGVGLTPPEASRTKGAS